MADKTCRNMEVVVRVRPLNTREMEQNQRTIIHVADDNTLIFDPEEDEEEFYFHGTRQTHRDITKRVHKKLSMRYDQVFGNAATNEDIFQHSMRPLVATALQGFNCSTFVYGATGAGKTFTMLGGSADNPGITYLTMRELFDQIETQKDELQFDIAISYLEVYNEQVMNLLTKQGPLKLREDSNGVVISGLALQPIHSASELMSLLALGNQNRTQHPTDANAESSRSHAIFQVHIRMMTKTTGVRRLVKLSMIDLAGSERGSSTKCVGQRFKEGASINKSLLALGNCINKLADGSKHIPYRDSNMTRILKDSLGGNCKTVMIANVSPSSLTYEDTYNTLKYASRAQKIRSGSLTKNALKTNLPKEYYIRKLTDVTNENEQLIKRVKLLEAQVQANKQAPMNNNASSAADDDLEKRMAHWEAQITNVYDTLKSTQENYFAQYSKMKILKFRTNMKEETEKAKSVFVLNGLTTDKEVAKLKASCDTFAKQIGTYQADMQKWLARFNEASTEIPKIRAGIKDKRLKKLMQPIFVAKRMELEKVQVNLISDHVHKLNTLLVNERNNLQLIQKQSNEILQQDYFLLKANALMTSAMEAKFEQLYKAYDGHRGVTFSHENTVQQNDDDTDINGMILRTDEQNGVDDDDYMDCDDTGHTGTFAIPTGPKARRALHPEMSNGSAVLDATQVIGRHDDQAMDDECQPLNGPNATFLLSAKPTRPGIVNKKASAVSRILKDTNPNISKDVGPTKGVTKPFSFSTKPTPTATMTKEKENKRIMQIQSRKSPRRNGTSPSNALKKVMNMNRPRSKTNEPIALKRLTDPIRPKAIPK